MIVTHTLECDWVVKEEGLMQKVYIRLALGSIIAFVMMIAYTVLWRLWHVKHHMFPSHTAWSIELVRTLILLVFLILMVHRKSYQEFFVASICCSMTDMAWLIRLLSVQMR